MSIAVAVLITMDLYCIYFLFFSFFSIIFD